MKSIAMNRLFTLAVIFTILNALVFIQTGRVQINYQEFGHDLNEAYKNDRRVIYPGRGDIYDRWNHVLAGNKEVYELGLELLHVEDKETIAMSLASVLDKSYPEMLRIASTPYVAGKSMYYQVDISVTPEQIKELDALKKKYDKEAPAKGQKARSLSGLVWHPRLQRSYPEKSLAATVLGFYAFRSGDSGYGVYGVEEKYNELLAGAPQEFFVPVDPYLIQEMPKISPGASLQLTIDREIQSMAERVLNEAVEYNQADSGTIVIEDPRNGEILAMVSTPQLDPNRYWELDQLFPNPTPYNRAIEQTYEPGSVFKVLTMASALDAGAVGPETPFFDPGYYDVNGIMIENWDGRAWGQQNMTTCMQHSLNVCLTWIAMQLGQERFYQYADRFGIGHRTNIDLAGEQTFPVRQPNDKDWTLVSLATNSFGQGIAVTPIQMVMAVSAIANDGKMMAPHVLKAIVDNGKQYNTHPQIAGTPISAQTARTLTSMLAVSLEEEASTALVPGYRVAGKTGTAEIPTASGYTSSMTNASFVGWGPADDPRFLVYIWLEKPKTSIWGSEVAAPVFSKIVSELVVLMDLPPDQVRQQTQGQ